MPGSHARELVGRVLALYSGERKATRFHLAMRARRMPFAELERFVPGEGRIADLGCGHGIFANLLSLSSPGREVTGIDKDAKKIAIAARTVRGRRNIQFRAGDLARLRLDPFDAIAILGVLYLIPSEHHRPILEQCMKCLMPGGMLLLNTVDPSSGFRFWKSKFLEFSMNLAFRLIGAQSGSVSLRLYPRRREEWRALLSSVGFAVDEPGVSLVTPGNVFLCRKARGGA